MIPGLPNLSVLRTFRVLRPLRSLARAEGLKKIIGAVLDSIPSLANVIVLLLFLLLIFSIAGLVFWNGILHARCRLTPFPINMPLDCTSVNDDCWSDHIDTVRAYYEANYYTVGDQVNVAYDAATDPYRCTMEVDAAATFIPVNDKEIEDADSWTKDTSPWNTARDCIWPLDNDDARVCTLTGGGMHSCSFTADRDFEATCGSDFDDLGNARFIDSLIPYGTMKRMVDGEFVGDLNYGYTSYDNIFRAFTTTFQACSMEGWTDIM